MERPKSREEIHKELQELLAASKVASGNTLLAADGTPYYTEGRRSQEKRKNSTEVRRTTSAGLPLARASSELAAVHSDSAELPSAHNHTPAPSDGKGTTDLVSIDGTWAQPGAKYDLHNEATNSKDTCWPQWLPFRAIAAVLREHPSIWITSLLVMLLLAAGGIIGVMATAAQETQDKRTEAQGFAINAAVAFERQLAQMFGPLLSLSTIIRFDPDYAAVNRTFDSVAKELLNQMPTQGAVTTLIAAPQGVLHNFYPLKGYCQDHCENININLFRDPDRRSVALQTVKRGALTMQGPLVLAQGYFGVVGRLPVFISPAAPNDTWGAPDGPAYNCSVCYNATTQTRFWGFVNAVINLEPLISGEDSRMRDLAALEYLYKMYKIGTDGQPLMIAVSSPPPSAPVATDVDVPGGQWVLEVAPEAGWVPPWRAPILAVVVLVSCLFGLLLGAILVSSRLQMWLKTTNEALNQEKQRMDVLLARQYNLISCVLQQEGEGGAKANRLSMEKRTLAKIEDMRREIGVTNGTGGVDELQLIELIDEGTYGKVFKGMWRGSVVAVKTMVLPAKMSGAEKRERMAIMEAAISSAMNHPNVVQTYTYIIAPCCTSVGCTLSSEGGSSSVVELATSIGNLDVPEASASTVHNFEVSLVLEFCDWGSLRTALDAGAFFAEDNSLNYAAILDTAADIARAMMHLHKNQVVHSDLKVRNVLLKSDASGRGCVAKVADFGLAVRLDTLMDTHVSAFQGTMSHMAPEALLHGHISKAGDMYSFGITLWELFTGGQPYQGIPRALVGHKVAVVGLRPTLPPFTPPDFRELVEQCWHQEPDKRPGFEVVLAKLVAMRQALAIAKTPPLQRYKLQTKQVAEKGNSCEPIIEAAAANGLVKVGSSYVSGTETATALQPGPNSCSNRRSDAMLGSHHSGYIKFIGRTMGTGSQLEPISDTEAEFLEAELQEEQQKEKDKRKQTDIEQGGAASS